MKRIDYRLWLAVVTFFLIVFGLAALMALTCPDCKFDGDNNDNGASVAVLIGAGVL